MKTPQDLALGSYEAACLMGVHFTRTRLMAGSGKIISRPLASAVDDPAHVVSVYSSADCERDFREYEDRVAAHGGKHYRRPRAWLHLRPEILKRLAREKNPIDYADAISVQEAMAILKLASTSQIQRLITNGQLVGRKAWNPRYGKSGSQLWLISRRSVEQRKKAVIAAEMAGKKTGLRKFVAKG